MFDTAEPLVRQALQQRRSIHGPDHPEVAKSLYSLAKTNQAKGKYDTAEQYFRQALEIYRKREDRRSTDLATTLAGLGSVLRDQNEFEDAERFLNEADLDAAEPLTREALEIRERVLGPEHPLTVTSMYELASVLRDKEDYEPALALFGRVYGLDRQVLGKQHHYVGLDLREIALTYLRMEQYDDAVRSYQASLDILNKALPPDHSDIIETRSGIGLAHMKKGNLARAESILRDVLGRRTRTQGEDSWWTGGAKSLLGECLMLQGRYKEAEPLLITGYDTLRDASGPLEAALRRLIKFYEITDRSQKAQKYQTLLVALTG